MTIQSLQTTDFRNLSNNSLVFDEKLNIVAGPNGSGKTSILEALYILTSGRSFRTNKLDAIIRRDEENHSDAFVVFGSVKQERTAKPAVEEGGNAVGLRKARQENIQIKINGDSIQSAALLAKLCPVVLLEPGNLALLTGSTQSRRKFLDWSVFHVEHSFATLWKNYRYCLKQRNALLRQTRSVKGRGEVQSNGEFSVWDRQLETLAIEIDGLRRAQFEILKCQFDETIRELNSELAIELQYRPGWDTKIPFTETLSRVLANDSVRGHTSVGPHRMDVRITVQNKPVVEILSRGQLKLVSTALYLSQVKALKTNTGRSSVVLLDDVSAELDTSNTERIFDALRMLESQVICTTLDSDRIIKAVGEGKQFNMFHVEHGLVTDK